MKNEARNAIEANLNACLERIEHKLKTIGDYANLLANEDPTTGKFLGLLNGLDEKLREILNPA